MLENGCPYIFRAGEDKVSNLQARSSERDGNALSVALELQADCFAGVWGHYVQTKFNMLESGDVEEAMTAAQSIGDDRLQRMSGRAVNPDSFTHGTSQQRVSWFQRGFQSGNMNECNTFSN